MSANPKDNVVFELDDDVPFRSQTVKDHQNANMTSSQRDIVEGRDEFTVIPVAGTNSDIELNEESKGWKKGYNDAKKMLTTITSLKYFAFLSRRIKTAIPFCVGLSYIIYFIAVLVIPSKKEEEDYWCKGDGFLIIVNVIICIGLFYHKVLKPRKALRFPSICQSYFENKYLKIGMYIFFIGAYVIFVVVDSWGSEARLISAAGLITILFLAAIFSKSPKDIKVIQIFWGISLQAMLGLLIVRWSVGKDTFQCIGDKVNVFLTFTDAGTSFVFGDLISSSKSYAFTILPVVLFFSMTISTLYFYGIIQWVIINFGWLLEVTMGTTPCESMNAAGNIFLGQSEAPLIIRPYITLLTKSEIHAVMTGGYATIAGGVMAVYVSYGINAAHLISASLMSAPAALAISKIMYPETEESKTASKIIKLPETEEKSVLHAVMNGLFAAIPIIAMITACIICFIAFMTFVNATLDWSCQLLSLDEGVCELEKGLGYVLSPFVFLMGVEWNDCYRIGYLLAKRALINDLVAYKQLMDFYKGGLVADRSVMITTYALCGFASIGSIGAQMGSLGSMAPEKKGDIAEVAFRAFIGGTLASFMTACVAGTLSPDTAAIAAFQASSHNATEVYYLNSADA